MKRILPALALVLLITTTLPAAVRKWTSHDGKFTTDAEFVEFVDEKVTLKKRSGETISVPVELLSEVDRRYLRTLKKKPTPPPKDKEKEVVISYAKDVQPFLTTYCAECHSPGKAKDGYDVTTMATLTRPGKRGVLVVPGKPAESRLIEVMRGMSKSMPPNRSRQPMPEEITKIATWIEGGAKDDAAAPAQEKPRAGKGKPKR